MLLNLRKYYRPRSVEAAVQLLSANPARCRVLAGGTYLLAQPNRDIEEVVDISALKLKNIKQEEKLIRIGATVPLQFIVDYPRLKKFAGGILGAACRACSVSRMIRNQRSVGGEICAAPNGDVATVLMALDARLRWVNAAMEERELMLTELWASRLKGRSRKESGAAFAGMILEVLIPRPAHSFVAVFDRIAQLDSQASLLSVAAVIHYDENRLCTDARVVLGSMAEQAWRLAGLEKKLSGKTLTPELAEELSRDGLDEVRPRSDSRATAVYRRIAAAALVRRVLLLAGR